MNEKDHETYREGIEKYASETLGLEGEARDNFTDLVDSVTAFAAYGRREADEDTTKEASEETPLDRYLQKMAADGDDDGGDDGDDIPFVDRMVSKATDFVTKHPMAVGGLLGTGAGGVGAWALNKNPLFGALPGGLAGAYYGSLYAPGGKYGADPEEAILKGMKPVERAKYHLDKAQKRWETAEGDKEREAARQGLETQKRVYKAMKNDEPVEMYGDGEVEPWDTPKAYISQLPGIGRDLANYVRRSAHATWTQDEEEMKEVNKAFYRGLGEAAENTKLALPRMARQGWTLARTATPYNLAKSIYGLFD